MKRKVLVTGFEPFGEDDMNPSLEVIHQLNGKTIDDVEIVVQEVPTVFHQSTRVVIDAIKREKPDVVICIGQAGGRVQITPERIAINVDDARIPDNEGNQPIDEPIDPDGPAAYFSTLPIKRIVKALRKAGIPSAISNSAGTFVCNHLFYGVMNYLAEQAPSIRAGFIHIPYIPEQTVEKNLPSLSLDLIVKGIEIAVTTAAKNEEDIRDTGGTIH